MDPTKKPDVCKCAYPCPGETECRPILYNFGLHGSQSTYGQPQIDFLSHIVHVFLSSLLFFAPISIDTQIMHVVTFHKL